jgi:tetratricopeptide (TPR) repeat protein
MLRPDERSASGSLPRVAVYGPGGVGKSSLVVRVGHALRADFPGGQLFVDLRGAQRDPLEPGRVLAEFLAALGVPARAVPEALDERTRLFRSVAADRRILVVLDNAADEAQVRPLLPAVGCAVAVTSRRPLAGLEGFMGLRLDVLDARDATELLAKIAGMERVRAEPEAAERIAGQCCGLPLAVRAAGARLSAKPHWPLDRLASRLADERHRLDELSVGDLEVRASLGLTYAGLSPAERGALQAGALVPTGEFAAWPVGAAREAGDGAADDLAERLVDAQLLNPAGTDQAGQARYRLHDLTRVFALERFAAERPVAQRAGALADWLETCVALTAYAVRCAGDRVRGFDASPGQSRLRGLHLTVNAIERAPFDWYAAERAVLVGAVDQGRARRHAGPAWRLAHALAMFFEVSGAWDDWRHTHEAALRAVRESGDRAGEAALLSGLGRLELDRGRDEQAVGHLEPATELARALGLDPLLAQALRRLGQAHQHLGRRDDAMACYREALALGETGRDHVIEVEVRRDLGRLDHQTGRLDSATRHLERGLAVTGYAGLRHPQPWILTSLGEVHLDAGRVDAAAGCFERAVAVADGLGDRRCYVYALRGLADARRQAGSPHAARELLDRALALARELGEDLGEAQALRRLGDTYAALDQHDEARVCLTRALRIVRTVGHPRVEAEVLLALGAARGRAGRPGEAGPALERSARIFRELGFVLLRRRAERELTALRRADRG